jgi:Zn ribbon nucleic-acid-binding protein
MQRICDDCRGVYKNKQSLNAHQNRTGHRQHEQTTLQDLNSVTANNVETGSLNKLAKTNETKIAIAEHELEPGKSTTNEVLGDIYDDIGTLEELIKHTAGHIIELSHKYDDLTAMLNNFDIAIKRLSNSSQLQWENAINAIDSIDAANAKKFDKLHICPDCGAALHLHRLENQGNIWHLECISCGYYSPNYKATVWKDKPGKHPIPVKEAVLEPG